MKTKLTGAVALSAVLGLSVAGYALYHKDFRSYQSFPSTQRYIGGDTTAGFTITEQQSTAAPQSVSRWTSNAPAESESEVGTPTVPSSASPSWQPSSPPTQPAVTVSTQSVGGTATAGMPANTQPSSNWAGYVAKPVSGNGYTSVSGSWTVPRVASGQSGAAAQWVGLGGVSSNNLLQMGTVEQGANGSEQVDVFWEKLPNTAQSVMTIPVGSTVHVTIAKAAGLQWNLEFSAATPSGQTVTRTIRTTLTASYAQGIGTSAEWISEDPSNANGNLYPLASTAKVQFTGATVNHQAPALKGNSMKPMALVSSYGTVLIAPSKLGHNGQSFSTQTVATQGNIGGYDTAATGRSFAPGYGHSWRTRGSGSFYPRTHRSYGQFANRRGGDGDSAAVSLYTQRSTNANSAYVWGR
ncbi:G1 family glutamic endopeptidase [Alicyclobacillus sp. SO9]|uniref:G1 family glutamic endopeptidase n=1 Tax=Alicyclobacillus sp. SO9 TaxID=2665646 RepID=UPI0018E830BD|nr:G1 family glutamic endopeptidase [Alicyclobacillus sp. SO9]QQE77588.1 hypothetical protein GI364_16800 [Alicyclobacillus sp. SO9]